ncbi:MAG: signal recognition particle protein Srp54 [Hadesarchaea archaeon]|nr:signal recognition particle protein Srp54 [Hadesarchaea archaeon]
MVLEKLGQSLHSALRNITKSGRIDKKAVKSLAKDIQRALLQADVKVELVLDLTKRIEERALEEEIPKGASRKEHLIKIVYEELSEFLGEPSEIDLEGEESKVILMIGLQGSGKTTSTAKIANYYKKRGYTVGVVCADTYRPGAYEQLEQLGGEVGVPVYGNPEEDDAVKISEKGTKKFKKESKDLIIIDSAGRHRQEEKLMEEMKEISQNISPDEIILVIDGTLGQQAESQAEAFNETTDVGSILITKLDGTAKGGGALSAVAATGAPIKFIGTGEKIAEIELFKPERFVARLLGMGDIETLLEKIQETAEPEEIEEEKMREIMKGKLSLRDVYNQLERLSDMGPLKKMLQMLPGVGMSIPEDQVQLGKEKLDQFKVIMNSMTDEELDNPKKLDSSRIERIAKGSGTEEKEIKELLEQYEKMKKLMKSFSKGRAPKTKKLRKFFDQMPDEMR